LKKHSPRPLDEGSLGLVEFESTSFHYERKVLPLNYRPIVYK
jgi:hypothetical protein